MVTTCAHCKKIFTRGGLKDGDLRYCSAICRNQQFMPRLAAALAREAAESQSVPEPSHAVQAGAPVPEPAPPEAQESSLAVDTSNDLIVIGCGVGATLIVGVLIYLPVHWTGYPFHAHTVWFVIPLGAFVCGIAAGGGFWVALRVLNRLPTTATYLAAGLAAVVSYVLIYFMMWMLLGVDGAPIRHHVGFGTFLQYVIEHQSLRMMRGQGNEFEIGKPAGYMHFGINLAGFVAGALGMVAVGGGKTYCPDCKRYYRTIGEQSRSSSDPEATAAALHPMIAALATGRVQEALQLHGAFGTSAGNQYWTMTITVEACPCCGLHVATLRSMIPGDDGNHEVPGFTVQGKTRDTIRLYT